jgi:hypothetical protein
LTFGRKDLQLRYPRKENMLTTKDGHISFTTTPRGTLLWQIYIQLPDEWRKTFPPRGVFGATGEIKCMSEAEQLVEVFRQLSEKMDDMAKSSKPMTDYWICPNCQSAWSNGTPDYCQVCGKKK